ncbi:MAG TPA: hypothetical protein IAB17_03405 [Candidatus Alectryocaccobium stercorigallinarum]|nr:hypothetical protein [Candidatus Alectryocaccobium stercorigallinarum]
MKKICRSLCAALAAVLFIFVLAGCEETGYSEHEGVFIKTDSGHNVLLQEDTDDEYRYVFLEERDEAEGAFDELDTGDRIRIKVVKINEEDGVMNTEVFECEKISDGSKEDIDSSDMEKITELDAGYTENS